MNVSQNDTPSHPEKHRPEDETGRQVRRIALPAASILGGYLCFRMMAPFASALVWSVALAIIFAPLQRWFESKISNRGIASGLSVLVVALLVVIPALFVGQKLVNEAVKGAQNLENGVDTGVWQTALDARPSLAWLAEEIGRGVDVPGAARSLATRLSAAAGALVQGSIVHAITFCIIFYLLFFFLRDRTAALHSLRATSPFSRAETDHLLVRVEHTIQAILYGTLAVSMIQGLLGGLMFAALGLPAPWLWGLVMALLAVVPVLGAFIIWIPAACYLAAEGSWGKALILVLWGLLVVGTIDNLLRPVLVGKRLRLHTVLAFLSVLGGLALFGSSGLILGPVIVAVSTALLELRPHRVLNDGRMDVKPVEIARWENEGGPVFSGSGHEASQPSYSIAKEEPDQSRQGG